MQEEGIDASGHSSLGGRVSPRIRRGFTAWSGAAIAAPEGIVRLCRNAGDTRTNITIYVRSTAPIQLNASGRVNE